MGDSTLSVSKGVFIFKNKGISQHKRIKTTQGNNVSSNIFSNKLWYQSYYKMWNTIEKKIETVNNDMFASLLQNLVLSIKNSYNNSVTEIPTATLLTGINMPDHSAQFSALSKEIRKTITPHIATLYAEDCQSLKYAVENTVHQIVNNVEEDFDEVDIEENTKHKIRKPQCTFALLQAWYEKLYGTAENRTFSPVKRRMRDGHKLLVVIIPDFESFCDKVIQNFILIISSYLNKLPFVMVFGVATSLSAVHKSLPYHVSSKISVQVFNSQQSTTYLNNVIEHIFFTDDCPFHLGGKIFNFFTDIFLFYDLSVKGFIKNFKFAMLEHFSYGNIMALCTAPRNIKKVLEQLNHEDLENIRRLPSYKNFSEKHSPTKKSKLTHDEHFKNILYEELQNFHAYLNTLHLFLKCLYVLVQDLPKTPLGKQLRELYSTATSKNITKTPEYKECFQLLGFQSKDELSAKIIKLCDLLRNELDNSKINKRVIESILEELEEKLTDIENATTATVTAEENMADSENTENLISGKMDRKQLKEKLLQLSKKSKPMNKYEQMRSELIKYLQSMFENFLEEPSSKPFHEIFFFNDMSIKRQIIGSHRAALHTALSDPEYYLQCSCCKLSNEATILPSMPDICILYKLHLEHGKLINLYDFLQSFLSIVDPDDSEDMEDKKVVKPELQARFTQAVADLEFLGFIKSSKRKADHVTRLTWGG